MKINTIKFDEPEKGIGIIITGAGRGFCSGADLKSFIDDSNFRAMVSNAGTVLIQIQKKYSNIILQMRRLPQPVISAVNGSAAGAGMSLSLASDVVIAGPRAGFTPSFINIGLSGGELGTSYFLPRLVGSNRAAEILMTGRTVHAGEGERIGLITRLVEEDSLMETALEVARKMLAKSPLGLRLTKEVLNQNQTAQSLEAALELENRNQSICVSAPEFSAAVEAFSKR
ncbi:MAG: enoyl-CoA hydratase/isomerase family protein [Deltaproteobacteria bacterium]|nr:enoyl-CoA hydratase/isomerase family protein [Deltaproteobacteria bacterium]